MDYLEELFRHWEENGTDSEELHHALTEIYPETCEKEQEVLLRCVSAERRNAFKAGFDCAVQLLKAEFKHFSSQEPLPKEEWRKIKGYHYSVSNYGRVRNDNTKRILKPHEKSSGYLEVHLRDSDKSKNRFVMVHRLVANAFIPPIDGKFYVNHIDRNKRNNCVSNLEWVTPRENTLHALKTNPIFKSDGKHPVLVYSDGVLIKRFSSKREVTRELKISHHYLDKILSGEIKHPDGYIFEVIKA